jgi:large conductance mechanosensitive channel
MYTGRMKNFLNEFKEFAVKGSVVDLAIGIIIGTAFNKIVTSLVTDIVLPPIGLVLKKVNFSNLFVALDRKDYANLAEAQAAGAPTINYGMFLDNIISFTITAFVVFLLVRYMNKLRRKKEVAETKVAEIDSKNCPFCTRSIPIKATRCPECTSSLT